MYIKKYWGNYIGGTDDSLNLIDYLKNKEKNEFTLDEIFSDIGLNKQKGDYRNTTVPLEFICSDGIVVEFDFAIDLITDLAALLLECKVSGGVNLNNLEKYHMPDRIINITATAEERIALNQALNDFTSNPHLYDLGEMVPDADMEEMAGICETLRMELFM